MIRKHFDDHAVIVLGLGPRSVANAPVFLGGRCAAMVNFLCPERTVRPGRVAIARLLGPPAAPDWAAERIGARPAEGG